MLYLARPDNITATIDAPNVTLPRYNRRFWAAFAIPLTYNDRRYININSLDFGADEGALQVKGADVRPIDGKFIATADFSGGAAGIARNIECWLKEQHLDATVFHAQRRGAKREVAFSLLEQMLSALDGDQLKRVILPLDVVRTLIDRRAR